jgi:hypothetical protein
VIATREIAVSDGDSSRVAYEELRGLAVTGSPFNGRLGLVVLLREGLAAWFALRLVGSDPARTPVQPDRRAQAPLVSDEIHASVVHVLASMVLGSSRTEISI